MASLATTSGLAWTTEPRRGSSYGVTVRCFHWIRTYGAHATKSTSVRTDSGIVWLLQLTVSGTRVVQASRLSSAKFLQVVKVFWEEFTACLKEKCYNCARLILNLNLILFGVSQNIRTDKPFDFILLYAKFYIHKCKLNKDIYSE